MLDEDIDKLGSLAYLAEQTKEKVITLKQEQLLLQMKWWLIIAEAEVIVVKMNMMKNQMAMLCTTQVSMTNKLLFVVGKAMMEIITIIKEYSWHDNLWVQRWRNFSILFLID